MCRSTCTRTKPGNERDWCGECRQDYDQWLERGGELARISLANLAIDQYVPVTDAEWRTRLDDVAPLVIDLAECPMPGDEKLVNPDTANQWLGRAFGTLG
jgi:hypothetical protein